MVQISNIVKKASSDCLRIREFAHFGAFHRGFQGMLSKFNCFHDVITLPALIKHEEYLALENCVAF